MKQYLIIAGVAVLGLSIGLAVRGYVDANTPAA